MNLATAAINDAIPKQDRYSGQNKQASLTQAALQITFTLA